MAEQTSFALLYKKLLDRNLHPDPARAAQTLAALLRELPAAESAPAERSAAAP